MSRAKYSKEEFYDEIKRLYEKFGRIDKNIFKDNSKLKIDYAYYCHKYGGIKNILNELGLSYITYNQIKREDVLRDIQRVYSENGDFTKSIYEKYGKYAPIVIYRELGGWNNARKYLGIETYKKNITKEEVLNDIKKVYDKFYTTSSTVYRKYGEYSETTINKFGGWVELLKELNLKPINEKFGKDFIINEVVKVYEKFGFISKDLINSHCPFTYQAFKSYFANMNEINEYFGKDVFLNCRKSTNAKIIEAYLKNTYGKNNVYTEYTWDWLINKYTGFHMYVDFYIPVINSIIEYDGEQHFKYVEYFHKDFNEYLKGRERDALKDSLIKENSNLNLIRFDCFEEIDNNYIKSKIENALK